MYFLINNNKLFLFKDKISTNFKKNAFHKYWKQISQNNFYVA